MSVNKSTAQSVAYSLLGVATFSFVLGYYFFHNSNQNVSYQDYSKLLTVFSAVCIIASASAGMAWKQSSNGQTIINFVNCILASFLVAYGRYQNWNYLAIALGALIGIMSCFEFVVDDN